MTDLSIGALVEPYLTGVQHRKGDNLMAICPFHRKANGQPEKTPSFWMSLRSGKWMCHSCKEAGVLADFLRDIGLPPALLDTTYKATLDLLEQFAAPHLPKEFVLRQRAPAIEERILGFFDYCPYDLLNSGFAEEVIQRFDVGYDNRNHMITYPLRDFAGRLIGIRGRATVNYGPRFKTYTEREYAAWALPGYEPPKTDWLWNYHRVAADIFVSPDPKIVLVEGFKACMWVYQAGVKHVVALGGSTMSDAQQMMLERLGGTVYLFLDNDLAGRKALNEIAPILLRSLKLRIVPYLDPSWAQPTSIPLETIPNLIDQALDYLTWRNRYVRQKV